jgi:hypothetical protein
MTEVIESDRARREAAQAVKAAERAKRMEELMAKQRAVASGRRQKPSASSPATSASQLSGLTAASNENETDASEAFTDTGKPFERLRAMEAKLAAVVAGITDCHSAEHVVDMLTELKDLCFRLFASLTEAHTRLEALEDRVGQTQEAANTTAAAAALKDASRVEGSPSSGQAFTENDLKSQDFLRLDEQLKSAEQQVQAVCTEVHHLCHRVRSSCPEIDAVLEKEGAPTAGTLLMFIGMLEHWANSALDHHTSSSSSFAIEDGGALGASPGGKKFWAQYEGSSDNGAYNGRTALLDPPSVGHRNSLSGRSSSSGSSGSAGGGWKKKGKSRRGGGHHANSTRQSQASSDMSKIMDMEVLAQRAKRAVEMRLADATAVTVTAHSLPSEQPSSSE